MPVMKIEIDIIFSVASSLIGKAVVLVIMYVKTFETVVNVFIYNVLMCLASHRQIIFNIRIRLLILTI
jgi:hypothetical protein